MELDKKKYRRDEVENLIFQVRSEYEEQLSNQKFKINELISELKVLQAELLTYKENDEKVSLAIKDAEDFSLSLKNKAKMRYDAEVESLRSFALRWRSFFNALKEKYPLYGKIESAKNTFDKIAEIVSVKDGKTAVAATEKVINNKTVGSECVFDPKGKINEYISATSDNGFNMGDVLNPGELELETLCKELGLIEEK